MKKVIASAGLLALGAAGLQTAKADMAAGSDKSWMITGTVRGFYDDNYNTQPDGSGRVGSGGFEIRPGATYKYADGPTTLNVGYNYSLKCFTDRPGNKLDQAHEFDLTANHTFSERYSLDLEESFVSSQEPEVLSSGGATVAPLRANGDNYHNSVGLNFHAQLTKLFGIVIGYNNGWYDYTGNPVLAAGQPSYGTLLNDFIHTWTFDGRYTINDETVAILEYKLAYTDYLSQGSLAPGNFPYIAPNTRNSLVHFADVGLEHSFRSDLGVNLHAGIQASDYYNYNNNAFANGSNPSTITPYADLSVSYTYTDSGTVTLGFTHSKNQTDVGFDPANGGSLTLDEESSTLYLSVAQVLKPISPDLKATLGFQYQDSTFNGGGYNNQAEDYYTVAFNLTYQFTAYLSSEIGYNYDLLDSGLAGRGYDRNRVYVGVTASY